MLAAAPPAVAGDEPPPTPPPDIVVVMVDDLGSTGCADPRILSRLPSINDLFVANGLCFDRYFNETPLCCPGRATFLTGLHTRNHHVTSNTQGPLMDPSQTIATALDGAGYWTVQVGKYLNGSANLDDKTPPGWDRNLMNHGGSVWQIQGEAPVTLGYGDRDLLNFAVAEAQGAPEGPLFMWLGSNAPHAKSAKVEKAWIPNIEPSYVGHAACNGIPVWKPPDYNYRYKPNGFPLAPMCRSLLTVDEMVGALRAKMTELGRNPIWVFVSDNGMAWGRRTWPFKDTPESLSTPLYISGPGVRTGTTTALLSNIDLAPTLAELGGATMPWAAGISFAGVLGADVAGREWMIEDSWHFRFQKTRWWGARQPDWHLIATKKNGVWKYRLHNLVSDPWEKVNVYAQNPAKFAELKALYDSIPP
jgi:arylsulfatase A-like enzyme